MRQTALLLHSAALRWGNGALIIALTGLLGSVGLVAWNAPDLTLFLPVVLLALCVGVFLFTKPRLNFIVWLGGLALLFSSEPGFQIHEVLYGLYFYAYLAHWYGRRLLLYKRPIIRGAVDVSVALWLVLGLGLGIALGLLFGADLIRIRGEAIAFTMLAIYFPIKEFCIRDRHGPAIILAILVWIGIWVTVDNLLVARQTITEATMLWEITDVRKAGRELLLTFSGVLLLAILPTIGKRSYQVVVALVLVILLGGLVLTKSRAFWVEYVVAVVVLFAISPGHERKRMIIWCITGTVILVVFILLFLSSYVDLLMAGTSTRFATLGAASTDLSLLNRFVEAEAVLKKVWRNPILGYGFGTDYSFFNIISYTTLTKSHIHVALVAVLYKFGLWGSVLVAYTWILSMLGAFHGSRRKMITTFERSLLRGIFACSFSMILPALTTSVFFEDEKLAAFAIITALGIGITSSRPRALPHNLG